MNKDSGGRVIYYIDGDTSGIEKAIKKAEESLASISDSADKSSKKVEESFEATIPSITKSASLMYHAFESSFNSMLSLASGTVNSIVGTFSQLSQIEFPNIMDPSYLKKGAMSGVKINSQIEDASLSLEKLLGSQAKAQAIQQKILKGAADTPFGVGNLTEYVQQLSAVTKDGDRAYDTVMAFGKAIKISGGSLGDMNRMIINLQQASSTGMTIVDYRQFKRAIPIFDDIVKAAGLTMEDLTRKAGDSEEEIKRKSNLLVKALEQYGASIPWSTFDNNFSQIKDSFEENISTTFANAMRNSGAFDMLKQGMIRARDSLVDAEPQITEAFKSIATVFKDIDFGKVIKSLASALSSLSKTLKKVLPMVGSTLKILGGGDAGKGIANVLKLITFSKLLNSGTGSILKFTNSLKLFGLGLKGGFGVLQGTVFGIGNLIGKIGKLGKVGGILNKIKIFNPKKIGALSKAGKGLVATNEIGAKIKNTSGMKNLAIASLAAIGFASALFIISQTPFNVGEIVAKFVAIGVVAAEIGFLSWAANKTNINTKGLMTLVAASGVIVAFAGAMWLANKLIPNHDQMMEFGLKMGALGLVIVEIGFLSWAAQKAGINKSGILALVGIAGTLVTLAGSMWLANKLMPGQNEMLEFGLKMAALGIVTVALGAIAGIARKFAKYIGLGLLTLVGVAVVLVVLASSLKFANSVLPGSDQFVELQKKIGGLALVVSEFALLAGVVGLVMATGIGAVALVSGLWALTMISASLAVCAIGIKKASDSMPSDIEKTKEKITGGISLLNDLKEKYGTLGGIVGGFVGSIFSKKGGLDQFVVFEKIAITIGKVAEGIKHASERIPNDVLGKDSSVKKKIGEALEFINSLKEKFSEKGGFWGGIETWWSNKNGTGSFTAITEIADKLRGFADNLLKLKDVSEKKLGKVVNSKIFDYLKDAMLKIQVEFSEIGGVVAKVSNFIANESGGTFKLDSVISISDKLNDFVGHLSKIGEVNLIKLDIAIKNNLPKLKDAVDKMAEAFKGENGLKKSIENFFKGDGIDTKTLEKSVGISSKLGEFVSNLNKISEVNTSKLESVVAENGILQKLKNVIDKIKTVFVDGEDSIKKKFEKFDVKYLTKASEIMGEISKIANSVSGVGDTKIESEKIYEFIGKIRGVVDKIVETFGDGSKSITIKKETEKGIKAVENVSSSISALSQHINNTQSINIKVANEKIDACKTIIEKIVNTFTQEGGLNITPIVDNEVHENIKHVEQVFVSVASIAKTVNEMAAFKKEDVIAKIDKTFDIVRKIIDSLTSGDKPIKDSIQTIETIKFDVIGKAVDDLSAMAVVVSKFPDTGEGAGKLQQFTDALVNAISGLANKLKEVSNVEALKGVGSDITIHILTGLLDKIKTDGSLKATEFTTTFKNHFSQLYGQYKNIGTDISNKLFEGFVENTQNKAGEIAKIITEKISWPFHHTYQKNYNDVGVAIIAGIAWGINSSIWRIENAMGNISQTSINKLKSLLDINSPSKVFYNLGESIGQGLADGVESMANTVADRTAELVNVAQLGVNAVKNTNVEFGNSSGVSTTNKTNNVYMTNNISNNMDLSAVMGQLKWSVSRA